MTIFYTGTPIVKTQEQKKITRISNRIPKRIRELRKAAPVTKTVFIAQPV